MRHFDLAPLYRSTVGFDQLFSLLDKATNVDMPHSYPPYNIERTSEINYRVSIAVAGFTEDNLSIESKDSSLTVRGEKQGKADSGSSGDLLYQGIASRAFEKRFQLADHVQVVGATLENGLLHIDLVREIPETKKSRTIPIGKMQTAIEGNAERKPATETRTEENNKDHQVA